MATNETPGTRHAITNVKRLGIILGILDIDPTEPKPEDRETLLGAIRNLTQYGNMAVPVRADCRAAYKFIDAVLEYRAAH